MIRQLDDDEQHFLEHLAARVYDGGETPVVMTPAWVRPYLANKVARLKAHRAEPYDWYDDRKDAEPMLPFGWSYGDSDDLSTDRAIAAQYANDRHGTPVRFDPDEQTCRVYFWTKAKPAEPEIEETPLPKRRRNRGRRR